VVATLTFELARPELLDGLSIVPLYARDFAHARQYGRIAELEIATDTARFRARLPDRIADLELTVAVREPSFQSFEVREHLTPDEHVQSLSEERLRFGTYYDNNPRNVFIQNPVQTSRVVITVLRAHPGRRSPLVCASTLRLYRSSTTGAGNPASTAGTRLPPASTASPPSSTAGR
jgi:hypothetical protein